MRVVIQKRHQEHIRNIFAYNITAVLSATQEERRKIMTVNISDLQHIASNLVSGGWSSKDAKEIQLEYNLCDDEVNALVEIMKEMEK